MPALGKKKLKAQKLKAQSLKPKAKLHCGNHILSLKSDNTYFVYRQKMTHLFRELNT